MKLLGLSLRFWLINLALLLIYGWTLTEETTLTIQVKDEQCTAVFSNRSSSIPCPGLEGGFVGLYLSDLSLPSPIDSVPLDWLVSRSAWRDANFIDADRTVHAFNFPANETTNWRKAGQEWRPSEETAVIQDKIPVSGDFTFNATLRRPDEDAGVMLLTADGHGWALITAPHLRNAVWYHWGDNKLGQPILGIPFQKPFLGQGQSLLRDLLRGHQGGLILLLAGWIIAKLFGLLSSRFPRKNRFSLISILSPKRVVVAATFLAFSAAIVITIDILERIPHVQDSITYLFQAQTLAKGHLWAPAPPLPEFFQQEFLMVENGRWYGKYTPGFPLILALGVLIDAPWIVNPLLATLSIPLIYALGKALYGRSVGSIAVILAVVSPFFLFMSASMMAHSAELFWITLFMLSWVKVLKQNGRRRWVWITGIALGKALLTRQLTAVALGLPFVTLILLRQVQTTKGRNWLRLITKTGQLAVLSSIFLLLLLGYQLAVTGDPFQDPRLEYWEYDRLGFSPKVGMGYNTFNLVENEGVETIQWFMDSSQPPRGHTPARGLYNTERNMASLAIHLFGWPPIFSLAFIWLAFWRPHWIDGLLLGTAAALIGAYVFYWADGIMYGPRYFYAALPLFLILTARGIQTMREGLDGMAGAGTHGADAVIVLIFLLVLGNLVLYMPATLEEYRDYNFVSGKRLLQVQKNIHEKALVFIQNDDPDWWGYGNFFIGNTPWLDNEIIFARDLGDEQNGRLQTHYPQHQVYRWDADLEKLFTVP